MEENKESGNGIATNVVEAAVALVILVIGAVVVFNSWQLGAEWASDGPGPGYFPFYIGLVLCISGAAVLYQSLLGKDRNLAAFVSGEQIRRVMSVLLPAGVYVVAIQLLGVYVASAIYITVFMVVLGKFSWARSAAIALSVSTLFFLMFEVWFKVPLYKGRFEPLGFLGY